MTAETQELVLGALDAALAQQVGQLFDVLMSAPPDEDGIERFMAGLNKAVGLHERLATTIGPAE